MRSIFPLVLLVLPVAVGCASHQSAPASTPTRVVLPSTPTGFTSDSGSIHLAYLRARSYTPDLHLTIPVAGSHTLFAVHSICTGSADGHCQAVDVFLDGRLAPILDRQYSAVQGMQKIPGGFVVVAQSYKPGDPLCCPSGPKVRDRYIWNGKSLVEHGPLPQSPSG